MPNTSHGALTAGQVKRVAVTPGADGIVVVNRSGTGAIWVRFDGTDPQVGGDDTYVVLGSRQFPVDRRSLQRIGAALTVRLLAEAATNYSVEAVGVAVISDGED
jgi:hypothetical protein